MAADLRQRLDKLLGAGRAAPRSGDGQPGGRPDGQPDRPASGRSPDTAAEAAALGPRQREGSKREARQRDVHDLVDGGYVEGPLGACFVAEQALAFNHRHGDERLGRFFDVSGRGLGCLARSAEPLDIDREAVVFLDTETTGLAGGTGTYAFLVGLAFFRDDQFVVRQYFMRDHAEEPAMLALLAQVLSRYEVIVTFNGKSFDVPLLLTRYTANRQRHAVPTDLHLDLLHPSRRFWREQLESCTLGTLERAVLGHQRGPDVPGWMIPDLYFRYLRGGDPQMMAMVFEHNRHDLLSLVALTCRLGRLLDPAPFSDPAPPGDHGPPHMTPSGDPPSPSAPQSGAPVSGDLSRGRVLELFAAARIYEDLGLWDEACARYEAALRSGRAVDVRARIASRLAALCKRAGRHERAIELWRRLASLGLTGCEPYIELAKHYEHRLKDFDAALEVVEEALGLVEIQEFRHRTGAAAQRTELERRRTRLQQKRLRTGTTSTPRPA